MNGRLPFWFRAAVAAGFGTLFAGFILLQDPARGRSLFAGSLLDAAVEQVEPLLGMSGPPQPFAEERPFGAYRVNGMRVEYATYPVLDSVDELLRRFAIAFGETGYEHKTTMIQGQPAVVAFHPDSKMLLLARIELGPEGTRRLRLSQQNLSQWRRESDVEVAGLPDYPGATGRLLIEYLDGRDVKTLTFTVDSPPAAAGDFYGGMLRRWGWSLERSPIPSGTRDVSMQFFRGVEGECSVVAAPSPTGAGALVMVTLDRGDRNEGDAG